MPETKCPKFLPPYLTSKGEWYDIENRCYIPEPIRHMFVRIKGKRYEVKEKWYWLFRPLAELQGGMTHDC